MFAIRSGAKTSILVLTIIKACNIEKFYIIDLFAARMLAGCMH